ncbi:Trehalose synthase/amylase TreS [compost metagenome]
MAQLKAAMTFFLTLPSVPLVYYGDEIGMKYINGLPNKEGSVLTKGNRAGSRTPMQWDKSSGAGFSSAVADQFYLPLDSSSNRPNVETQISDSTSLLHFTRKLLAIRADAAALQTNTELKFYNTPGNLYPLVYHRRINKEEYLVVINPSGKKQRINITKKSKRITPVIAEGIQVNVNGKNEIAIITDATAYGIFKIN